MKRDREGPRRRALPMVAVLASRGRQSPTFARLAHCPLASSNTLFSRGVISLRCGLGEFSKQLRSSCTVLVPIRFPSAITVWLSFQLTLPHTLLRRNPSQQGCRPETLTLP